MAGRIRTAKARARRIDMEYFKRPHPFRRWRLLLSIAAPAVGLLWIAGMAATGSKAPYSSGPLSPAHRVFGRKCERCHTVRAGAFRMQVSDHSCLTCHDAPAHHADQTFTPACATCHQEHRGAVRLSAVADEYCEQCHLHLQTTTGRATVLRTVGSFASGHPEFAVLRSGYRDPTVLRFNHAAHMKAGLRGPNGPTTLQCTTCHRTIAPGPPDASPLGAAGGRMAPVSYARDCASCHPLFFDPRIDREVPHDRTAVVHAVVVQSLQAFIAAHPDQIGRPDPVRGRIPVNFPPEPRMAPPRTAAEWVARRTTRDEQYLWSTTCGECHDFTRASAPGALPQEIPTGMPAVWMPDARFDHRAHRLTTCTVCHAATTSTKTSDVLMPSIATCRRCHAPAKGASSRCSECHLYHDWSKTKTTAIRDSGLGLRDVTGR